MRSKSATMRPPPVPDTVNWTAPELMRVGEEGWPTVESDTWALGMLLFEIYALEIPFTEGQCTVDLKHTLEHQRQASEAAASDDTEAAASSAAEAAAVAPPFFGREYLICRICDGDNPLRPPLCDDRSGRPSLVPPDVSTLLAACWADDPAQRISARTLKEQLYALLRNAPRRLSALETLHGVVGLPKVPALRPRHQTLAPKDGAAPLPANLSRSSSAGRDGSVDSDGTDGDLVNQESHEGQDSVNMTEFEARGKFGVGTLGNSNRSRNHSERGVGLPSPRTLGKRGSGAHQDPTGFGDIG